MSMDKMIRATEVNLPETEETAKAILEKTEATLRELEAELRAIEASIHSPKPKAEEETEMGNDCLLTALRRQLYEAAKLLTIAVHIREGLW